MFNNSKKEAEILEKKEREIFHNAKVEFSNKLTTYHLKHQKKQKKLQKDFSYQKLQKININIWDDFYDDGFTPEGETQNTYAYVEMSDDIPNVEELNILSTLIKYIKDNNLLPNSVDIELLFYDSTTKHPILVFEHEYMLYKRWQIEFQNITHEILEKLVEDLKGLEKINNVKVDIYSES
jgi:hypothetical protein